MSRLVVISNRIGRPAGRGAAQTGGLALAPVLAAAGALGLSAAQRFLSTPARTIRRRTAQVDGILTLATGETMRIDSATLLL